MRTRHRAAAAAGKPAAQGAGRRLAAVLATSAVVVGGLGAVPAFGASVTSAVFTGGAGTFSAGGALYAKQDAPLTLTVTTSNDTHCVDVAGAFTAHGESSNAKSSWTFGITAPAGDGAKAVTVSASQMNKDGQCTNESKTTQASYTLDNTGPVVSAALTPAANSAGWNNTDVTVRWTAIDGGSGVAAAQPFKTDNVTANGIVTLSAPAQSDRLGNTGAAGSATVRVDKAKPSITAMQTRNPDGTTTITFTCSDSNSGGGDASGIATCVADGLSTNSKTVQPGVTVTGTATDKAGNSATASSTAPAGDTTAPILAGAPTTQPNDAGWYKGDVVVKWTASDPESSIPTPPADTTIVGAGEGLTSSQTVKNGAGLSTTATSTPAVNIDRTAPTTSISGTSNEWINGNVSVSLAATDNLSGIAKTEYTVDGGAAQTGDSFSLSSDGDHTVTFFSTDKAGNVEATQTAHVKIDRTAPTIGHAFDPVSYKDGAWSNQDVTVTFACTDQGGSGVATCTAPVTNSLEGDHEVVGTATDRAGNSATHSVMVRLDKTAPTIEASVDREANAAGWYDSDVTVSFEANDGLSGIASAPGPKVLGESANQSASGTATDNAGNSASDGVSGINVDKTDPVLSATVGSGWHTGDVTVNWACNDELSGVTDGPTDDLVTGEGDNLSSTASCTDKAGNVALETVSGIKIDRTNPTTTAEVPEVPGSGWYGGDVEVNLTGSDNLSGVAATYYSVDGATAQTYSAPFSVGEGEHEITFWSKDAAGNVETAGAPISLKIDKTAPRTTVINPISPDTGWFVTSGIPVAFEVSDAGSGVEATYYTIDGGAPRTYGEPFTADLSTGIHTITFWSEDLAGNKEATETTNTIEVKVDTLAPSIEGSQFPVANSFGWNNTSVDVKFKCHDDDSGIDGVAGCAGDTTLANDGANQKVIGDAVDVAGNRSTTQYGPVNIDTTRPTLTGVTPDTNADGWYNGDVAVKWVGDDALSGINSATVPADSLITAEGRNLGTGPSVVEDKAGNVSEPASVSGIKIDRQAPMVSGSPTTKPNGAGWYIGDVTIDFTCSDPVLADGSDGSGVATCPSSKLLSGNGANQSVTSALAVDRAGNASEGKAVGGINIDGTAPTTTSNNTCTAPNDWCRGETADVVLSASDQAGLSGVKEIHYVVDGGTEQVAPGASTTVSVPLSGTGAGTVRYWAVDRAGNAEKPNDVALKWDNIAPTVTHTLSPAPNADGWNKSDVTVAFTAKDDDKGSGVASVSAPVTVTTETAAQELVGTAKDVAGNLGTDKATVKLDKTSPTITGAITSGVKGANGWYVGPVTVTFTCKDPLSGVAICPDPVTLTSNGLAQSVTRTATDNAGNSASVTVPDISIDQEKPTLTTADVSVQGNTYTVGAVPAATCTARDSFSGVASCTVEVTSPANSVGTIAYTATAADKAGNTVTISGTYTIKYRFDGFLQPINDTAHQVGTSTSIFKAGSTVPVKFAVRKADGTPVQLSVTPTWVTPLKGSATSAPVDESVYAASTDSGSGYRWDGAAQQYIYNWKSGSAGGNYWRIGVRFDDGQTYFVNIGLR